MLTIYTCLFSVARRLKYGLLARTFKNVQKHSISDERHPGAHINVWTYLPTYLLAKRTNKQDGMLRCSLSGLSPFMGDDDAETLGNVIRGRFSFDYQEFDDVSTDARDIISKLLVTDKRSDDVAVLFIYRLAVISVELLHFSAIETESMLYTLQLIVVTHIRCFFVVGKNSDSSE